MSDKSWPPIVPSIPVRTRYKGQKTSPSPKTNKRIADLWNNLSVAQVGSRGLKIGVVLVFTLCWLLIVLARSQAPRDPASLEGGSLVGLATAMQHGALSGRDFQSTYGPAAQVLAWVCTTVTSTQSPLDALGLMIFAFCAVSAVLIAAMLLLCDRISWQQAAVLYGFSIFLNLFYDVLDIRTVLLLLNVVFAYRVIAAGTLSERTSWAAATGFLCFLSQLVTFGLGIYAAIAIVCTLAAGLALTQNSEVLHGAGTFVGTLSVLNLTLVAFFKLTASEHRLVFDYHNYAFETLRGYHNTLGMLWQLPLAQTAALIAVSLYVLAMCVIQAWKSDPLDGSFYSGLAVAAILWVTTAFVRSDIAHIASAFTPMVVLLSLVVPRDWRAPKEPAVWVGAVIAMVLAWPLFNINAQVDLAKVVSGEVGAGDTFRALHTTHRPVEETLKASLGTPDQRDLRDVPLLPFPYDTYVAAGVRRPLFAPVLETYGVSTPYLEDYYLRELQRRRQMGLEIVFGPDRTDDPLTGGVQAITRTPNVFEYIYRNFALVSDDEHPDGHYVLRSADEPPPVRIEPLKFSKLQEWLDSGAVKLNAPSTCGMIRLDMRLGYTRRSRILRTGGINVYLSNGNQRVWQGSIRPLELNQRFITYISPLPPSAFHKVFGRGRVQGVRWDKLEYRSAPTDLLGAKASLVQIFALDCLDPDKFREIEPSVPEAVDPSLPGENE
jgi:hypothetical protein